MEKPHHQGQHQTYQQAGGQGKVKYGVTAPDDNIAGKAADSEGQTRAKGENEPGDDQNRADCDQRAAEYHISELIDSS